MSDLVKLKNSGDIKKDIKKAIEKLGGIEKFIEPDSKVLIKPSCNSPDPFPSTTDPKVIEAVIEAVKTQTKNITIGDSSGVLYKPTDKVFRAMGLFELAEKEEVNLINFDNKKWIKKKDKRADYLKKVKLTEVLDEQDKIIFLPTLRTHRGARFTMSLKLGMGFAKVSERMKMHALGLEKKIADLNLYFKPDLIIMDGRECFITDGPERGEKKKPGLILVGTNRVEIDKAGLKVLKKYNADKLNMPIEEVPVIKQALKLGIK